MAKQTDKAQAKRFGPEPRTVEFSSGVTGYITPLEVKTLRMLNAMLDAKHPLPEPPTEDVETVDGGKETLPVGSDAPEYADYLKARKLVAEQRTELWLDFVIDNCLVIDGAEDDDGKAALIEAFKPRRKIAEATGQEFAEDTDWGVTLRHFVLACDDDFTQLALKSRDLEQTHITQEEILRRMDSFRPLLEWAAAQKSGQQTPSTDQ